jgi:hypothetical protein
MTMSTATNPTRVESSEDGIRVVPTFASIRRRADRAREAIADSIDDGMRSMRRAAVRGRHAAEDAAAELRIRVRRDPLRMVGVAVAIGALSGIMATRLVSRRTSRRRAR